MTCLYHKIRVLVPSLTHSDFLPRGSVETITYGDVAVISKWDETAIGRAKPTPEELDSVLADADLFQQVEAIWNSRAAEYPSITDQLDVVAKGGSDFTAMQAKCLAVKAKYPFNQAQLDLKARLGI